MFPAIEQLIPHRAPMRWVDELIDCTETTATATTRFTAEHFAVAQTIGAPASGHGAKLPHEPQRAGPEAGAPVHATHPPHVIETALVECMAQTVAAALGHRMRASGKPGAANHGMLAAVANFKIHSRPPLDQTLTIEVREVKRLGPMLMITGKISCGADMIATGDLSLYA
jgi:predicted hotdog family 3-hydroxylacyl-ACP dehydratase